MKRKKPFRLDLVEFCSAWDETDHQGKLKLCEEAGITYETARHWRSDSGIPLAFQPKVIDFRGKKEDNPEEVIGEILAMKSKVELDFACYDIETTGLKADFSVVLSAVIKPYGCLPIVFRADSYPDWQKGLRAVDDKICRDITAELSRHAVIVTHYGSGYDIPYTRAKLIRYGLPPLPPMFALDTYSIAKANMLVSRRRLETLAEYLQLGAKSSVQGNLWMEAAMNGDTKAMDAIVEHNKQDCELLEKLACLLFPYLRSIKRL